jgi:tRNA pseudouridine13 synthase
MTIASSNKPSGGSPADLPGDLPRALGEPLGMAAFRQQAADFVVDEQLEVPEHAGGAHWWLQLRKRSMNTKDLARLLTELSSARIRQIAYAGLKDRHAVTSQWLSVPIEHLDPETLGDRLPAEVQLLSWRRARHAVRRGGLKSNRFTVRLRDCTANPGAVTERMAGLASGVPNYFGEQRFGIDGGNLARARALFAGTLGRVPSFERGMYLSAARSQLFNLVLAERIRQHNWNELIDGEAIILDGSRSWFPIPEQDDSAYASLDRRLAERDIHPSGPLHGVGEAACRGACAALEQQVLDNNEALAHGLTALRMRAERRSLRLLPADLGHRWEGPDLVLTFELPPGTYATVLLRELVQLHAPAPGHRES